MNKIPVIEEGQTSYPMDGKFHVRLTQGTYQTIRRFTSWPLLALYFATVWMTLDGKPAVWFSFSDRQILLFGSTFSWHDLPLLAGLMIAGACLLFFMAVAWGRVWCGFACPQSIWTWIFIRIEDWVEGSAQVRAKVEQDSLTGLQLMRRVTKHFLWIVFSVITALTFTGYFIPIRELLVTMFHLQISYSVMGWLIIMSGLTYVNAGLVREKICLHACPYSRFQSVMFDENTRTVSYDRQRGEPRSAIRAENTHAGDCVNCTLCVQVCPTGIDIRDGLQAACIDCAACIDACDQVMRKLGRETGLIRFASERSLAGNASPILRPYLLGYGMVCVIALAAVFMGFQHKTDLLIEISRDRGALFTLSDGDSVCNHYQVKLEYFDPAFEQIGVSVTGDHDFRLYGPERIDLSENNAALVSYRVCSADVFTSGTKIDFSFTGDSNRVTKETTFITERY